MMLSLRTLESGWVTPKYSYYLLRWSPSDNVLTVGSLDKNVYNDGRHYIKIFTSTSAANSTE